MKKILFVSTRDPYSSRYSGDVIDSRKILNNLKKKNNVDLVTIGIKENFSQKNIFIYKQPSFFLKVIYLFKSLLKLKPLQFGIFFSNKMFRFIKESANAVPTLRNCPPEFLTLQKSQGSTSTQCNVEASPWGTPLLDQGKPEGR